MKLLIKEIIILCMGIIAGVIYHSAWTSWNYVEPEPTIITEYVTIEAEPKIIKEIEYVPVDIKDYLRNLTEKEKWCLMDMSMREAENQGITGHCWVMYTMLCRAEAFGQTIEQVYNDHAFDSSKSRSGITPNDDCKKALALIEEGWTPKPLWFRKNYYHNFGNPLCQYGDHCFSYK